MAMNSYSNKEVNKIRYQVHNLTAGIEPKVITFGKPSQCDGSVAEVMNSINNNVDPEKASTEHLIYVKSHKDYYPSEQIDRSYEDSFNKLHRFGRPSGGDWEGKRIKKLMSWINPDTLSKVNCLQADFYSNSQPRVGEVKNVKNASSLMNRTFGKRIDLETYDVSGTLKENLPFNPQLIKIFKSLADVNKLRIVLKKRGTSFFEIEEELQKFDQENVKLVHLDELLSVLRRFRIFLQKDLFCELLKILKFVENDQVKYKDAINLLNWNFDFPEIPKTEALDFHYSTTYSDTIGNIPQKRLPVEDLRKEKVRDKFYQSPVAAIITPNIFAQYGLSYEDLLKTHSKETILSIIGNMKDFPKEMLDSIWEESLKTDGSEGVCILKFKTLLDKLIGFGKIDKTEILSINK